LRKLTSYNAQPFQQVPPNYSALQQSYYGYGAQQQQQRFPTAGAPQQGAAPGGASSSAVRAGYPQLNYGQQGGQQSYGQQQSVGGQQGGGQPGPYGTSSKDLGEISRSFF